MLIPTSGYAFTSDGTSDHLLPFAFLERLEANERKTNLNYENINYAINELEDVKQYIKVENLVCHGLDDYPTDRNGYIVKGRKFSEYMARKFKALLPLTQTYEQILSCISVAHTITGYKNPKNVMALVRFSNRDMRNVIFFAKKHLKGSNVSITEHLTPWTQGVLSKAKDLFGKQNAWTNQTKVKVSVGGFKYTMKSKQDCEELKKWAIETGVYTPPTDVRSRSRSNRAASRQTAGRPPVTTDSVDK